MFSLMTIIPLVVILASFSQTEAQNISGTHYVQDVTHDIQYSVKELHGKAITENVSYVCMVLQNTIFLKSIRILKIKWLVIQQR